MFMSEVMNHAIMSEYSAINEREIAHFIHSANLIKSNELSDVQNKFTQKMSKIKLAYIKHMQSLCFYRFSSSFIKLMM